VFTIGHSTRALLELIELLRAYDVEELVDVRRFPGSRRNPQFSADSLQPALAEAGIRYTQMLELGGRRGRPRPGSPNTGWRVAAFQAYADHMADAEWLEALAELEARARRTTVAYMCAEAVPWRCHRRLISDALVAHGWQVRHILAKERADLHVLQDFARVLPDGSIIYPAPADQSGGQADRPPQQAP
jgi:uncharacterized protein (DUF488 family)